MKTSVCKTLLLLLIWACSASAGIVYLGVNQFKEFDPELKLSSAMMDIKFERSFTRLLEQSGIKTNSIIHFTGKRCFCNTLAKPHKTKVNMWAEKHQFEHKTINIREDSELVSFVPSIPSVAVLGESGELVYFGPYSQGAGCLQSTGIIDEHLSRLIDLQASKASHSGAYIQSEAKGCYCTI